MELARISISDDFLQNRCYVRNNTSIIQPKFSWKFWKMRIGHDFSKINYHIINKIHVNIFLHTSIVIPKIIFKEKVKQIQYIKALMQCLLSHPSHSSTVSHHFLEHN